jgi:hypothetical protein
VVAEKMPKLKYHCFDDGKSHELVFYDFREAKKAAIENIKKRYKKDKREKLVCLYSCYENEYMKVWTVWHDGRVELLSVRGKRLNNN